MYGIVPLAGPDCYDDKWGIRPLYEFQGAPLVKTILSSREWIQSGEVTNERLIFVVREGEGVQQLRTELIRLFPNCNVVTLSVLTRGALLSALAGASVISNFSIPIVVDLVDMDYQSQFSPSQSFVNDSGLLGIVPYFESSSEKYSYITLQNGLVSAAVEKKKISNNASAGTYFFRNLSVFLKAATCVITSPGTYAYKDTLFLCPVFDPLAKLGKVIGTKVVMKQEVGLLFHSDMMETYK